MESKEIEKKFAGPIEKKPLLCSQLSADLLAITVEIPVPFALHLANFFTLHEITVLVTNCGDFLSMPFLGNSIWIISVLRIRFFFHMTVHM